MTSPVSPQSGRGEDTCSTVGVLLVFFGPLPAYAPHWVLSCGSNPTVSFHVVADHPPPVSLPANVHWHLESLAEFNVRATETLGFEVEVTRAYKLCDFKPAYGVVYEDILGDYDFWAYCDLDLVWGDLRAFLTDDMLGKTDVYSVAGKGYLSGAFTLFRNRPDVTGLFMRAPGYVETLQSATHFSFCEVCRRWGGAEARPVEDIHREGLRVSLTDVAREAADKGDLRLYTPYVLREPSLLYDPTFLIERRGGLWQTRSREKAILDKEMIMCHFVHNKVEPFFAFPPWTEYPQYYSISWTGLDRLPPGRHVQRLVLQATRATRSGPRAAAWLTRRVRARLAG
ncbi:DUF6625 family protein [Rubrivirga sp.]|uniref:DUF6625 family protein n=1 Tax=Rubrivirga sp. TaxID=1885344 RepID=UPI003B52E208